MIMSNLKYIIMHSERFCNIRQFEQKYSDLYINFSINNISDINDNIIYVKKTNGKKIELFQNVYDRLNNEEKYDYMYISWIWIKTNPLDKL